MEKLESAEEGRVGGLRSLVGERVDSQGRQGGALALRGGVEFSFLRGLCR